MSKTALVTGGLGEAICLKLIAMNYVVITTHSLNNRKANDWLASTMAQGNEFRAYPCDDADYDPCETAWSGSRRKSDPSMC